MEVDVPVPSELLTLFGYFRMVFENCNKLQGLLIKSGCYKLISTRAVAAGAEKNWNNVIAPLSSTTQQRPTLKNVTLKGTVYYPQELLNMISTFLPGVYTLSSGDLPDGKRLYFTPSISRMRKKIPCDNMMDLTAFSNLKEIRINIEDLILCQHVCVFFVMTDSDNNILNCYRLYKAFGNSKKTFLFSVTASHIKHCKKYVARFDEVSVTTIKFPQHNQGSKKLVLLNGVYEETFTFTC